MISAMNFKTHDKGSIRGFFDLRYHDLTIKGCRLMSSNGGLWIVFPQRQGQKDGETKWFVQVYLTAGAVLLPHVVSAWCPRSRRLLRSTTSNSWRFTPAS